MSIAPFDTNHGDLFADSPPSVDIRPGERDAIRRAMDHRNASWRSNPSIPSWVCPEETGLDRFFTRLDIARQCHADFLEVMSEDHADISRYTLIDPSAGMGAFYDLLPHGRRIGVEIVPGRSDFICQDYCGWEPPSDGTHYAVIGNPPFGYRAWLALAFINQSAKFADYIGFILPMAFGSEGKGSPKFRVRGAELIRSRPLPADAFVTETGQPVSVNAIWQVWKRRVNNQRPALTCNQWIDLFTVDLRKERLCGLNRISEADWFLQRTFYKESPRLVRDFSDVRYVCGYGIVIRKNRDRVTKCLEGIDWKDYSNLATHNCRHIGMSHIRRALTDHGFIDK